MIPVPDPSPLQTGAQSSNFAPRRGSSAHQPACRGIHQKTCDCGAADALSFDVRRLHWSMAFRRHVCAVSQPAVALLSRLVPATARQSSEAAAARDAHASSKWLSRRVDVRIHTHERAYRCECSRVVRERRSSDIDVERNSKLRGEKLEITPSPPAV